MDIEEENEAFKGRKIYKKDEHDKSNPTELEVEIDQMQKKKSRSKLNAMNIVKSHLKTVKDAEEEDEAEGSEEPTTTALANNKANSSVLGAKLSEQLTKPAAQLNNEATLTDGLNTNSMKERFNKNAAKEFSKKDLDAFNIENREEIYKDLANFNILVDDDNEEKFLGEKFEDYEKTIEAEKKKVILHGKSE